MLSKSIFSKLIKFTVINLLLAIILINMVSCGESKTPTPTTCDMCGGDGYRGCYMIERYKGYLMGGPYAEKHTKNCNVCHGTDICVCNVCNGTGIEYK